MRCVRARARGSDDDDDEVCPRHDGDSARATPLHRRDMSARQLRRAQGDAYGLCASSSSGDEREDDGEDEGVGVLEVNNPFAALVGTSSEDEDADEDAGEEHGEEKESIAARVDMSAATTSGGKKTKRGGKGRRRRSAAADADEDDLDALVREVAGVDVSGVKGASEVGDIEAREGGEPASSSSVASVAPNAALRLLVVDLRKMKAEDELKRLFGSRVVANVEAEENGRYSGRARALKQKLRSKTTFATFRDAWSTYRSEGIHMELCKDVSDPSTGMSEYAFVWKPEYEEAQFHFEVAVASHDPNRLFHLARDYPWHLETILRISELYHYSGQAQESSEMLERCLYACERAWHPTFASAASNGLARLDSSLPANKPLFEALFRHVINLTRRGCQKTALDTAKFLLGLDHTDPKGVLCCIDYFALRCGEEHWLIDFAQTFGDSRYVGDGEWQSHGSLLSFPGFAYSYAMALYVTADDIADADAALLQAMLTHPYAWSAVLSKIEANDAETKEILAHEHFDFSNCALACRSLEHLSDVFATRHHALWKPEATMKWAKKVAKMAINLIDSTKPSPLLDGLTAADFTAITLESWMDGAENAYAHIIIDDFQDVVKRQLPEDDPLAQRQPAAGDDDDD